MFLLLDNAASPTHRSYLQYNLKVWSGAFQTQYDINRCDSAKNKHRTPPRCFEYIHTL